MNWLAHLLLAAPDEGEMAGQLLGDFARGLDVARLPAPLQRGIALHRAVDRFTDAHPVVRSSRARLPAELRLGRGVAVDVLYDHFLARDFERHTGGPLAAFTRSAHAALRAHAPHLTAELRAILPRLEREDWLASYATRDGIALVLARMERRLARPLPLASAITALDRQGAALADEFERFWPELRAHVAAARVPGPGATAAS